MSRTYRCKVKKDLKEVHKTADEIRYRISLLDKKHLGILKPDEMEEIYRAALKEMGASEESDGTLVLEVDGIKITINTKDKTATARLEEEIEIKAEAQKTVKVYDVNDDRQKAQKEAEKAVEKVLKKELDQKIRDKKAAQTQKTREQLNRADGAVREKLRQAANEAYKKALREKASRMGNITEDREETLENGNQRLTLAIEIA